MKRTILLVWNGQKWEVQNYDGTIGNLCGRTAARALNLTRGQDYKLRIRQTKTAKTATVTLFRQHENGCWYWIINGTTLHDEVFGLNLFAGIGIDQFIRENFQPQSTDGKVYLRISVDK